jgi:hypothetical protein
MPRRYIGSDEVSARVVISSDKLAGGMYVLLPFPGNENEVETYERNFPEISYEFVKPYCYWARVDHIIFRDGDGDTKFSTYDNNGVPITKMGARHDNWIVRKEDVMTEQSTKISNGVDPKFYEAALADSLSKAMESGDVELFDKTVERITEYAMANPEDGAPTTPAEYKVEFLTGIVHGFLEATKGLTIERQKIRESRRFTNK